MAGFSTRGPTLTYVTDPNLTPAEQRRVLREFVRCSNDQHLRVAFRLPDAADEDVTDLLDSYLAMVEQEGVTESMLPPLIHNRTSIARKYPQARSWLPAGALCQQLSADIFSVHSLDEAQRAMDCRAREVMFGHVFATESHPGEPGIGLDSIRQVESVTDLVVTAIGGIDERSIADIAKAGVESVACIRAISRSSDIAGTIETMRENWRGNQP